MPTKKKAPSEKRRAASQMNGAKSKGPTTTEGKARASQNALRHGLRALVSIDHIAHLAWIEKLRADLIAAFQLEDRVDDIEVQSLLNEVLLASYLKRYTAALITEIALKIETTGKVERPRLKPGPISGDKMTEIALHRGLRAPDAEWTELDYMWSKLRIKDQ